MIRPLQSLMAGIFFSYFLFVFLRICRNQNSICPLFLELILKMPLVQISWLKVAAWIVVSIPLGNVLLIFFYYMLFLPLILKV